MNIVTEYNKSMAHYTNWNFKTNQAHNTINSHTVNTDSLEMKDGIAKVQLNQLVLACIHNRNNITKTAHVINTILFDIRETAAQYIYDPLMNKETYIFNDGTLLEYANNTWY